MATTTYKTVEECQTDLTKKRKAYVIATISLAVAFVLLLIIAIYLGVRNREPSYYV